MKQSKIKTAVFPNRYIQGPGAIGLLPEWIARLGSKALIVAGKTALREIVPKLEKESPQSLMVTGFGGECSMKEIGRIAETAKNADCDVIVALGGGKVIDTGKAVAHELGLKMIIVPTIASNDAPTSAISVVYTESGTFDHTIYLKNNPDLVLVDTEIIAKAPVRLLVAGMGDALATWFEADACSRSGSLNEAGGYCTQAALALARLCYETLLLHGAEAAENCRQNKVTPALEKVIEANTLLSGLGFESGGLASAHAIHNGLTRLAATHVFFHGEKVAFGTLTGLFLSDSPESLIDKVYGFCRSVGLPVTLTQIGITVPTEEDLRIVAEGACVDGGFIWHEPYEVTVDRVVEAMKKADERGRMYLTDKPDSAIDF
ncbi:MAG: glycerol dehydrogenase [Alphaproteobacteria bacterium]|nr:glycerol dehydrogenase [Alphaproteobacteria bacterium]